MKYLLVLSFLSLLSPFASAQSLAQEDKFSTLKSWFETGENISSDEITDIQDEIYVGRCYSAQKPDLAKASLLGVIPPQGVNGPAFPEEKETYHLYPAIHPYKKASFYDFWDKGLALLTLKLSLNGALSLFDLERGHYLETLAIQFNPKAKAPSRESIIVPIRRYEDYLVALFVTKKQNNPETEHKVHYSCYYFKAL
ncbi:MAG: hypothetical protein OXB88_07315 [Bacteriovoracales bacterium]|nr:hypothetical protein [Bacteriovoracales bacterium]